MEPVRTPSRWAKFAFCDVRISWSRPLFERSDVSMLHSSSAPITKLKCDMNLSKSIHSKINEF